MNVRISKLGKWVADIYLILVLTIYWPLIVEGGIGLHSNGMAWLAAMLLTSPFSWLYTAFFDFFNPGEFGKGLSYYLALISIVAGALTNIYLASRMNLLIRHVISKIKKS